MTTFENRQNTALLVVDVQNGVVEGAHERDAVFARATSRSWWAWSDSMARSAACPLRTGRCA
jgi:nicotinamidase-related amidase